MKVLSLFSGIGAFERALQNAGIDYELVNFCEVDKFAAQAYSIIHGVDPALNLGDITQVDETTLPKNIALAVYGFPCQDISVAGKKRGLMDATGEKTRSGLFFDALRIIRETQPKICIAENVKNLTSKGMKDVLDTVLTGLNNAGYTNYYRVLNARDYRLPQNRERVFIISVRNDIKLPVQFPPEVPLEHTMADYLERTVDEKFYLSPEKAEYVVRHHAQHRQQICDLPGDICRTLLARDSGDPKVIIDGNRYRYLTPREYWRFMGFADIDVNKLLAAGVSKSRLYKMAGNSIAVPVAEAIFTQLRKDGLVG